MDQGIRLGQVSSMSCCGNSYSLHPSYGLSIPTPSRIASSYCSPTDRKFIVKNVVLLRNLCFCGDWEESQFRLGSCSALGQWFTVQFNANPDHTVIALFSEFGQTEDPAMLAQFLFGTLEIDRAQLPL